MKITILNSVLSLYTTISLSILIYPYVALYTEETLTKKWHTEQMKG